MFGFLEIAHYSMILSFVLSWSRQDTSTVIATTIIESEIGTSTGPVSARKLLAK